MHDETVMGWNEMLDELRGLRADVYGIKLEIGQYRGFVRGAMWSLSALGSVIGFVGGLLFTK